MHFCYARQCFIKLIIHVHVDSCRQVASKTSEDNIKPLHNPKRARLPRIDSDEEGTSQSECEKMTIQSVNTPSKSAAQGVRSTREEEKTTGNKSRTMQQPIDNFKTEPPSKRPHTLHKAHSMYNFSSSNATYAHSLFTKEFLWCSFQITTQKCSLGIVTVLQGEWSVC